MITSIWQHSEDICPRESGHYLAYKLPTLGDDSEGFGLYYWDNYYTDWRETMAPHSHGVEVSIWTPCPEHDTNGRVHGPVAAEIAAWKNVCEAIDQYNIIKKLVK